MTCPRSHHTAWPPDFHHTAKATPAFPGGRRSSPSPTLGVESEKSFLPLHHVRLHEKVYHLWTRKQALTRQRLCQHFDLTLSSLQNCEINFCCLEAPLLPVFPLKSIRNTSITKEYTHPQLPSWDLVSNCAIDQNSVSPKSNSKPQFSGKAVNRQFQCDMGK